MRRQVRIHLSTRTVEITYSLKPLLTTSEAIGRQDNSYKFVRPDAFTAVDRRHNVVIQTVYCAGCGIVADEIDALNRTPLPRARAQDSKTRKG